MTFKSIQANEFVTKLNADQSAIVVDVRGEKAFDNGHLLGAINIPLDSEKDIADFDTNKSYFVHCEKGNISKVMATILSNSGFKKVYHLEDDFVNIFLYLGKKAVA